MEEGLNMHVSCLWMLVHLGAVKKCSNSDHLIHLVRRCLLCTAWILFYLQLPFPFFSLGANMISVYCMNYVVHTITFSFLYQTGRNKLYVTRVTYPYSFSSANSLWRQIGTAWENSFIHLFSLCEDVLQLDHDVINM